MMELNDMEYTQQKSWIEVPADTDFPLLNLPWGIGMKAGQPAKAYSRIGDTVIDLTALAEWGYLKETGIPGPEIFSQTTLNDFISLGKNVWRKVRERLLEIFHEENGALRDNSKARARILSPVSLLEMQMPVRVGDYTDFYSSLEHATNVGVMFRDPSKALLPNWRHIPVGYHGRASSIVVSGTFIHRPLGQTKADDQELPVFGPSQQMDFELEMAFITAGPTKLGSRVSIDQAEDLIFGLVLFNDLSARDIQKWEYVPLGPFLSKSFGSVISPWVVSLDALQPFRVAGPKQEPEVLPYLKTTASSNFDINLEVFIAPQHKSPSRVCLSNFKHMYWSMAQQLAHHTVNGCNINPGDMMASGTISGPDPGSYGSLLELAWKGSKPISLDDGSLRTFLHDYDSVIMRGFARNGQLRIGFGECHTTILPSS